MLKKWAQLSLIMIIVVSLFSACSSSTAEPASSTPGVAGEETKKQSEPITLSLYQYGAGLTDEAFNDFIVEPVKKKYPHITLQLVREGKGASPVELITAGKVPDLLFSSSRGSLGNYVNLEMALDLTDAVKKNKYDLSKFEPSTVDSIRAWADKNQLYGFPTSLEYPALFYNKDIFDRFAVSYPKDEMTWEQVLDLSRRLDRVENGVQYQPLYAASVRIIASSLELPYVDPKTDAPTVNTEGWKTVLQLWKSINEIPGNKGITKYLDSFYKDQKLAMMAVPGGRISELEELHNAGTVLNWDLTTYPSFSHRPNIGTEVAATVISIYKGSKYIDEAFKVMEAVTDEQNQLTMSQSGMLGSLKDPKYKDNFGTKLNSLKGKNVKGMMKSKFAPMVRPSKYTNLARNPMNDISTKVANGELDINTALKQAEEEIKAKIQLEKSK